MRFFPHSVFFQVLFSSLMMKTGPTKPYLISTGIIMRLALLLRFSFVSDDSDSSIQTFYQVNFKQTMFSNI